MAETKQPVSRVEIQSHMYQVADKLLDGLTIQLRESFKDCWFQLKGIPWKETLANGKHLMEIGIGTGALKILKYESESTSGGSEMRVNSMFILSGIVGTWDIPLLTSLLQEFLAYDEDPGMVKVHQVFKELRQLEKLVHERPHKRMTCKEYTSFQTKLQIALVVLKIDEEKVAETLKTHLASGISVEDKCKVKECVITGQIYEIVGDYKTAAKWYTSALSSSQMTAAGKERIILARFQALKLVQSKDYYSTLAVVQDALEILKLGGEENIEVHDFLENYFISKNIPYQALHHCSKGKASNIFNICPGTKTIKESSQHLRNCPGYKLLVKACYSFEKLIVFLASGENDKNKEFRLVCDAMECFKLSSMTMSVGKVAYAAALIIFQTSFSEHFSYFKEHNVSHAIDLLAEVAHESSNFQLFGDKVTLMESERVGFAQYSLGLLYETGLHLEKNHLEAEKWYKKAAVRNNTYNAALNLGLMYVNGTPGIEKDGTLARFYFQHGARRQGQFLPVMSLGLLYLHELHLSSARDFIGAAFNSTFPAESGMAHFREWFLRRFRYLEGGWMQKTEFLGDLISRNYEIPNNLSKKGLTFLERIKRAELLGFENNVKDLMEAVELTFCLYPPSPEPGLEENVEEDGGNKSEFAKRISLLKKEFEKVYKILLELKPDVEMDEAMNICEKLYSCLEQSPSVKIALKMTTYYGAECLKKIMHVMLNIIEIREMSSVLRTKATLVYLAFTPELSFGEVDFESVVEHLAKIESMGTLVKDTFPDNNVLNIWYAEFIYKDDPVSVKEIKEMVQKTLEASEKYFVLFYFLGDLSYQLYSKGIEESRNSGTAAGHQCDIDMDLVLGVKEAVVNYWKFLGRADFEHPFYPISAYSLAWAYIRAKGMSLKCQDGERKLAVIFGKPVLSDQEQVEIIENVYGLGVTSEKLQLPCFPSSMACKHLKERVEIFLEDKRHSLKEKVKICIRENDFTSLKHYSWRNLFAKRYLSSSLRIVFVTGMRSTLKNLRENPLQKRSSPLVYERKSLAKFMKQFYFLEVMSYSKMTVELVTLALFNEVCGYLALTIVEDVVFDSSNIYFLAEDEEGSVIHVGVEYGTVVYRERGDLTLEFGTQLTLIFPKYIMSENGSDKYIFVGKGKGPGCKVVLTDKVEKMCRFCACKNSAKQCSKCKKMYCSEECQKKDYKVMKHKLVCY